MNAGLTPPLRWHRASALPIPRSAAGSAPHKAADHRRSSHWGVTREKEGWEFLSAKTTSACLLVQETHTTRHPFAPRVSSRHPGGARARVRARARALRKLLGLHTAGLSLSARAFAAKCTD
jgi:hypothetical protein